MTMFQNFIQNEEGATAIEYGLIAALIAVVLITALNTVSNATSDTFNSVATAMNGAN